LRDPPLKFVRATGSAEAEGSLRKEDYGNNRGKSTGIEAGRGTKGGGVGEEAAKGQAFAEGTGSTR